MIMMLRYIYTFFVGLFLATFVGLGVAVFYVSPKSPEIPIWYEQNLGKDGPNEQQRKEETIYLEKRKAYDKEMLSYNRDVSIIVLIISVIILAIALLLSDKTAILADGILLGGFFTLLYGIGRGLATDSNVFRFVITTIGLTVTIVLGYVKFIKKDRAEFAQF